MQQHIDGSVKPKLRESLRQLRPDAMQLGYRALWVQSHRGDAKSV
jgi:hypothetical protein